MSNFVVFFAAIGIFVFIIKEALSPRAAGIEAVTKHVRGQLEYGETLLRCDRQKPSLIIGLVMMLMGYYPAYEYFDYVSTLGIEAALSTVLVTIYLIPGIFLLYTGFYLAFWKRRSYFFVTDKRLHIHKVRYIGMVKTHDINIYSIQKVTLKGRTIVIRTKDEKTFKFKPLYDRKLMFDAIHKVSRPYQFQ